MILNRDEAILCDTPDEYWDLMRTLVEEGYRSCTGDPLNMYELTKGVRWLPGDRFPCCVALVTNDIYDELKDTSRITHPNFTKDHGAIFRVRYWNDHVAFMSVEDLL